MEKILDDVRDYYNNGYRFLLNTINRDMNNYSWSKETCLNMLSDIIHAQMKIRNEYIDDCKLNIKSSKDGKS